MKQLCTVCGLTIALCALGIDAQTPRFFPDDPITVDVETQDASGVASQDLSDPYDFLENTFLNPADSADIRAVNVNTLDEVPDSMIGLALGTAGAWLLHRYRYRAADLLETLAFLPMIVPEVILGVSLLAGPVMALYFLAIALPKLEFVGTSAWFFLSINLFKVPFSAGLGLIRSETLLFNAVMAPVIVVSVLAGRSLVRHIPQILFDRLLLAFAAVAALRLIGVF